MAEFTSALQSLADRVTPPDDAFQGLARRRRRRQRNRRIGAAVVALAVAGTGIGVALLALGGGDGRSPGTGGGYYVEIPSIPDGYDEKGLAILDAATNLPDGTVVDLYFYSADEENPDRGEVKDGAISIRIWNGFCHETEAGLEGSTWKVTVIASPVSQFGRIGGGRRGGYSPEPQQPPSVQAELGPHFEKLTGDQVKEVGAERMLVASNVAQLPADTCHRKYAFTQEGSYKSMPIDQPIWLPSGPFPQPPFASCPDPEDALPVEAGEFEAVDQVAQDVDVALTAGDNATLQHLADPSVTAFEGWTSTNSDHPRLSSNVPSGNYLPTVQSGCGALVALRTIGATLSSSSDADPMVTYLLILRPDGWRVWGQLPGDGRH
jgi:hypothetical protein